MSIKNIGKLAVGTAITAVGGILISKVISGKINKTKDEVLRSIEESEQNIEKVQEEVENEYSEFLNETEEQDVQVDKTEEYEHKLLDMSKKVEDISNELRSIYPIEGMYGSARSLWTEALSHGDVTAEKYQEAEQYYGTRWHYTGD